MACVKRGGDRQELHEVIRRHAQDAAARVKNEGADNDLLERLAADPAIGMSLEDIHEVLDMRAFVGRAPEQVDAFVGEHIAPVLERNRDRLGLASDVRV
jgi:adenylosuccinate lyase